MTEQSIYSRIADHEYQVEMDDTGMRLRLFRKKPDGSLYRSNAHVEVDPTKPHLFSRLNMPESDREQMTEFIRRKRRALGLPEQSI